MPEAMCWLNVRKYRKYKNKGSGKMGEKTYSFGVPAKVIRKLEKK